MAKVLVVGSSNTDMVIKASRFPSPGETILGGDFFMFPGGKGANQAVAAVRLGGTVTFVSRIGTDIFGDKAIEGFRNEGINTSFIIRDKEHPSGVALIMLNSEGENEIVVASGANGYLSKNDIDTALEALKETDLVITQLECPLETVSYLLEQGRKLDKRIVLNPAPAIELPDELFKRLYCITPNETEAEILTGISAKTIEGAELAANRLLSKGVLNVVITMGEKGVFYKGEQELFFLKANKVEAADTTGAGDVFNGALAVALSKGAGWKESIQFAIDAAGISVTRMGAQVSAPTKEELERNSKSISP